MTEEGGCEEFTCTIGNGGSDGIVRKQKLKADVVKWWDGHLGIMWVSRLWI